MLLEEEASRVRVSNETNSSAETINSHKLSHALSKTKINISNSLEKHTVYYSSVVYSQFERLFLWWITQSFKATTTTTDNNWWASFSTSLLVLSLICSLPSPLNAMAALALRTKLSSVYACLAKFNHHRQNYSHIATWIQEGTLLRMESSFPLLDFLPRCSRETVKILK